LKKVYSQERFMKMPRPKRMRSLAFRVARGLFVAIAGAYLLLVGIIWYAQTKILFHPSAIVDVTPGDQGVKFDPVILRLGGDQLTGWWVPSEDPQAKTLLYLHGNAANVAANVDQMLRLRSTGLNVFIFDYRGYGHSTGGPPREKLLYEGAERAWTYLVADRNIPPANIAIYGHSMGGAVGIDLASRHPDAGVLITEGALTSIADRADGTFAAFLPVLPLRHYLSRLRFEICRMTISSALARSDPPCVPRMTRAVGTAARGPGLCWCSRGALV
jgi:pimeloyl-ACP methyl ester carboxylesterase